MSVDGVLIQDPATGRAYRVTAEQLSGFEVQGATEVTADTVTLVLPTEDVIEELPSLRRAMLQFGS